MLPRRTAEKRQRENEGDDQQRKPRAPARVDESGEQQRRQAVPLDDFMPYSFTRHSIDVLMAAVDPNFVLDDSAHEEVATFVERFFAKTIAHASEEKAKQLQQQYAGSSEVPKVELTSEDVERSMKVLWDIEL